MMLRLSARVAAVIAALVALQFLCVVPYRGNLELRAISERSALAQSSEAATGAVMARQNLDDLDRVAAARRLDPAWYMLYAANCSLLGRLPAAVDAYTRALAIDDRPELYINRGELLLRLGRTDAAIRDLVTAARFDPAVVEHLDGELRERVTAAAAPK
jgi:tetratricopeptide (TPR) repeat protein